MIKFTLLQTSPTLLVTTLLFILIVISYFLGALLHRKRILQNPSLAKIETGSINGALLALLGLLLAFTFNMSSTRYDTRRRLIIEEANDIGTAILRADLYPDSTRNLLRNNFEQYVNARIMYYQVGADVNAAINYANKADKVGKNIWKITCTDARVNNNILRSGQMIPALNAMIDITTTRQAESEAKVPDSILYFLFLLSFCSSFLLGYSTKNKVDWVMVYGFSIMLSITVYIIMDLDRSRRGLINLDAPQQKMIELKSLFKVN